MDTTRQYYQNTFSEVLRVFSSVINSCYPFTDEYDYYPDSDSVGSDIKHQDCQDRYGRNRVCTPDELKEFCNAIPTCAGFNSNGWLKAAAKKSVSQSSDIHTCSFVGGVDLYIRKTQFIGNVCEAP